MDTYCQTHNTCNELWTVFPQSTLTFVHTCASLPLVNAGLLVTLCSTYTLFEPAPQQLQHHAICAGTGCCSSASDSQLHPGRAWRQCDVTSALNANSNTPQGGRCTAAAAAMCCFSQARFGTRHLLQGGLRCAGTAAAALPAPALPPARPPAAARSSEAWECHLTVVN